MTYFCTECKKRHADQYKVHWKYKAPVSEKISHDSEHFGFHERLGKLEASVDALINKVMPIIEILKSWKMFIDRKHPYSYYYQPFFEEL